MSIQDDISVSYDSFCSCSRTIGYKNRADADACRLNCCIRGFASAMRRGGFRRTLPGCQSYRSRNLNGAKAADPRLVHLSTVS
jgi:hypothetical protein